MRRILEALIWSFITFWMPLEGQEEIERDRERKVFFGTYALVIFAFFVAWLKS